MKPGDRVWNAWQGLLRFGVIQSQAKHPDGWTYFTVDWGDDKDYQDRIRRRSDLIGGTEHGLTEYRADQIHPLR